jgi:heptaprenyl diphosphate synthase
MKEQFLDETPNLQFESPEQVLDFATKNQPGSYLERFSDKYQEALAKIGSPFTNARQLQTGNRFRPQLVCWGYLLAHQDRFDEAVLDEAAALGVSMELLHKGSLIIDDVLDEDTMRNGQPTFHHEFFADQPRTQAWGYSSLTTIMMMIRASENIRELQNPRKDQLLKLLADTESEMANKAMKELGFADDVKQDFTQHVLDIADGETVTLFKNSLLCGPTSADNPEVAALLNTVGHNCGYIAQILNDAEPFYNPAFSQQHKGKIINNDVERNRKNYLVARVMDDLGVETALASSQRLNAEVQALKPEVDGAVQERWQQTMAALGQYKADHNSVVLEGFEMYMHGALGLLSRRAGM